MKKTIILLCAKYLLSAILAIIAFGLLGSFYNASNQVILVNLIVWTLTLCIVYLIVMLLFWLLSIIFKNNQFHFLDGYALVAEWIGVAIFTLAIIKTPDQSLFLNVSTGVICGVAGFIQLILQLTKRSKKKEEEK